MSKIGKAIGFGSLGDEADSGDDDLGGESPASSPEPEVGKAEVLAMKQFERASTPEAKAQALKDFLEACGVYSS